MGRIKSLPLNEIILRNDISKSGLSTIFHGELDKKYYYEKNKGKYPLNSFVLPLGVEEKNQIAKHHISHSFAVIGRLDEHKKFLIASIKVLSKFQNLNLFIVGNGPYMKKLVEISKELNVSDRVQFLGSKVEVELEYYLKKIDFVVTSGSGLTLFCFLWFALHSWPLKNMKTRQLASFRRR